MSPPRLPAPPPLRQFPQERARRTHEKLLASAGALFMKHGYRNVQVPEIARDAGLSVGAFYRYFDDKNDLFGVLASAAAREMHQRVTDFPAPPEPDAVREWVREWFVAYEPNLAIIGVWVGAAAADPVVRTLGDSFAAQTGAAVAAAIGGRDFGDVIVDTMALIALIERAPIHVDRLGVMSRDAAVEAMTDIIVVGVLGGDRLDADRQRTAS